MNKKLSRWLWAERGSVHPRLGLLITNYKVNRNGRKYCYFWLTEELFPSRLGHIKL
jgi:hypothetical protein